MIDQSGPDPMFEADIRLQVPEYTFELSFASLPYYLPKRLIDINGNLVDYCPELRTFMAYETTGTGETASFTRANGKRTRLYTVEEQDLTPFTEEGVVQVTAYNCGPAAALQVLDLLHLGGKKVLPVPSTSKELWYAYECCVDHQPTDVSPANQLHHELQEEVVYSDTHPPWLACYTNYTDRQVTMMEETGTTWLGTPEVQKMAEAINSFCEERVYSSCDLSSQREADFHTLQKITLANLQKGYPLIFMVNVRSLKSYRATDTEKLVRHYITAIGYRKHKTDIHKDVLTVLDPNYTPGKRGKYTVTLEELLYSMTQAGLDRNGNVVYADIPLR